MRKMRENAKRKCVKKQTKSQKEFVKRFSRADSLFNIFLGSFGAGPMASHLNLVHSGASFGSLCGTTAFHAMLRETAGVHIDKVQAVHQVLHGTSVRDFLRNVR
jgi:hypothetical protein